MSEEMSESARRLLEGLVDIENRAIAVARVGGCQCSGPVPDSGGRSYPVASFDSAKSIGKPLNQVVWEMRHEEGCPMEGQKGVGFTTYGAT